MFGAASANAPGFKIDHRTHGFINMMRRLVLIRHGQSEWNLEKRFTGWKDPELTANGRLEARDAGKKLLALDMTFDVAFASQLQRAQQTLEIILDELGQKSTPTFFSAAINERDYGDLSGMSKSEARARWGEEQVRIWRRSYDVAPPNGESLRDTVARVAPFYNSELLPRLMQGESVVVVAHGNSLRALAMSLEGLTPETVADLEISTADIRLYDFNEDATVASRKVYRSARAVHES